MSNVFDINRLAGQIKSDALENAKAKAIALSGQMGLNRAFTGRVLPPLPPYPVSNEPALKKADGYTVETVDEEATTVTSIFGTPMCWPLSMKPKSQPDSDFWTLPVEPMITIGGGNELIRRRVAKSKLRGTIKERWNVDDYTINISGLLTRKDNWIFPKDDFRRLRNILESREAIDVQCELLEMLKIGRIVIEKYDFPFTKGEENQAYTITAYSDDDWDLFIKLGTP